jgi:hypothetical protein
VATQRASAWSDGLAAHEMPRYHVRTRDSLVGEIADGLHGGERKALEERELLEAALKRMDREGWKLVAAAGEALLFRALHTSP